MTEKGPRKISRKVVVCELIGVLCIIAVVWLDEIIDLPHLILGAEVTPINWKEAIIESLMVSVLGAFIIGGTIRIFRRIKHLEGILPVCAYCKRIKDDKGQWNQIEEYIYDRSEAEFSHGLCPECAKKLFPDLCAEERDDSSQ